MPAEIKKRWTAELRKIERQFDGLPAKPSPAAIRIQREADRRTKVRRDEQFKLFGTWSRLVLVAALGAGITFLWPYPHSCGSDLWMYIGAEGLVVLGGVWTMASSWRAQMAFAHILAIGVFLWGLGLVGLQVVPRTGLPGAVGLRPVPWDCVGKTTAGSGFRVPGFGN
jgi:hypothetical protein